MGVEGVGSVAIQPLVQVAVDVENGLHACVTEMHPWGIFSTAAGTAVDA